MKPEQDFCIQLIHIGKCGGSTVISMLKQNKIKYNKIHITKPIFNNHDKYLIVLRNPIERFISAFNWRYKLVVIDKIQNKRFIGEKEVLQKYKSVNTLAENIREFNINETYIHHIKENISFYLDDFLKDCRKENIIGVVITEKLNSDMKHIFGIDFENIHKKKIIHKMKKYFQILVTNF